MDRDGLVRSVERVAFKYGNACLMAPLLRAGLGWLIGSPPAGYFMLLRTTGCKSGLPRDTPLNYAIDEGDVVCLAGFGERAHWLRNLRSDPRVQVRLPDRAIDGEAAVVAERAEARRLAVAVARNSGLALALEHPRCLLMSDAELAARLDGRPVVRIRPRGAPVVPGPYDPGGQGWVLPALAQALALAGLVALLRRRGRARALEAAQAHPRGRR